MRQESSYGLLQLDLLLNSVLLGSSCSIQLICYRLEAVFQVSMSVTSTAERTASNPLLVSAVNGIPVARSPSGHGPNCYYVGCAGVMNSATGHEVEITARTLNRPKNTLQAWLFVYLNNLEGFGGKTGRS